MLEQWFEREEKSMLKVVSVILVCLSTLPIFGELPSKYQVGTIMDVKVHQAAAGGSSDVVSYDVSLKVDDTTYVVLYTPPLGAITVRYAAGRELLVRVGKKTITYNDILGNSLEVPILSRKPATDVKPSK
jgi:hypothetical protein